ncbi:PapD-like protein [Cyathus striatus]|nr:PapD-like protein [Cyathus striatus]
MSVSLNPPNTLGFRRPLTTTVKRSLFITNHNSLPLYCVRPNSGRVEPGDVVEVAVMLQALREEPPLNAKCKDKFLIQSTVITPEKETLPLSEIWVAQDTNDDKQVYQQKLRVAYLPAEGQTLEEEDESGAVNQSSLYIGQDNSQFGTVSQKPHDAAEPSFPAPPENTYRTITPPADFSVAREESHESHPPHREPEVRSSSPPAPAPAPVTEPAPLHVPPPAAPSASVPISIYATAPSAPAPAPVPIHETSEFQELMAQYRQAQLEIERLRTALSTVGNSTAPPPTELRRRTRVLSDVGSATDTDVQTVVDDLPLRQEGVPLEIVAFVALGVFLTTYLFL